MGLRRNGERLPYRWHTTIHVALLYGRMTREPFTVYDLREFSPIFSVKDKFRIVNALRKATEFGHVVEISSECWQITPEGIGFLYYMAHFTRRGQPLPAEEMEWGLLEVDDCDSVLI